MLFCIMGNSGVRKREIVGNLKDSAYIPELPVVTDTDNKYADNYIGKEQFDQLKAESKLIAFRTYGDGARTAIMKENIDIALADENHHYIVICTPKQFTEIYNYVQYLDRKKLRPMVIEMVDEKQRLINLLERIDDFDWIWNNHEKVNGAIEVKATIDKFYNDENYIDTKLVNNFLWCEPNEIDFALDFIAKMLKGDPDLFPPVDAITQEDIDSFNREQSIIEELMMDPKNLKGIYVE